MKKYPNFRYETGKITNSDILGYKWENLIFMHVQLFPYETIYLNLYADIFHFNMNNINIINNITKIIKSITLITMLNKTMSLTIITISTIHNKIAYINLWKQVPLIAQYSLRENSRFWQNFRPNNNAIN